MRAVTRKPSPTPDPRGPIARKVSAALLGYTRQKVVNLAAIRQAREHAEEQNKTVVSRETMLRMDPAHALYTHIQNVVSVISENLSQMPELDPLVRLVEPAEDAYKPMGPPMSPLTTSCFTCWAFFDGCMGKKRETVGTIILDLAKELGYTPGFGDLVRKMQGSRMGLYIHEGRHGERATLKELITGDTRDCYVASRYQGTPGELWLVRLLPPPVPQLPYWVAFTTPYVIVRPGLAEWMAYFERSLPLTKVLDPGLAYAELMKFGLTRKYWNEFILEAYVRHEHEAIFLEGLPDVESSRPHSSSGYWSTRM